MSGGNEEVGWMGWFVGLTNLMTCSLVLLNND